MERNKSLGLIALIFFGFIGIIIACSVAYYFVMYLPSQEAARVKREEDKEMSLKLEEARKTKAVEDARRANQLSQDACTKDAYDNYASSWADMCKEEAKRITAGYNSCRESLSVAFCKSTWGEPNPNSDCKLPGTVADNLDKRLKEAKSECVNRYPTN